jgi:ABC-type transport system substrate-binding protein
MDERGLPSPWLATSWKVNEAALTVTLTLREGVKFHDGTPFNAEAARWNLLTYMAGGRPELASVETVDILNNYTIRLRLREYDSMIIPNLSTSAGMMISPTAVARHGREWADSNPVGTGPFRFVSWQRDVKQVYERFEDYWQEGKPYLDRIEWVFIADPMAQGAAFRRGDIDVIVDVAPKEAAALVRDGKYRTTKTPTIFWGLKVDSANPHSPLSNLKVRQAIWHAINTEALSQVIGLAFLHH